MLSSVMIPLTIIAFVFTTFLILWRPNDLNEAIPATIGALLVVISGSVSIADLGVISNTISNAAITIMATIVMANVLESFGFFYWAAEGIAIRAKGSGIRLFFLVNLICFLMTLLFNNDGSILITTPILLILLRHLGLKDHEMIPYLLSGALIATASSAPIGVSNIVNLIAIKIVDMSLYMHTAMMFIPATLGLLLLVFLLFLCFYRQLPHKLPTRTTGLSKNYIGLLIRPGKNHPKHPEKHPHKHPPKHPDIHLPKPSPKLEPEIQIPSSPELGPETQVPSIKNRNSFMRNVLIFVFLVRVSLFIASYLGIPIALVAVLGSLFLLGWRWAYLKVSPADLWRKIPWHIFVFAFSMYVIIYGLNNIGLTGWLVQIFKPMVSGSLLMASLTMGSLQSTMSIFFNNHPALLIGTLTLVNMDLDPLTLKIAYLASVIGSDMGSLLLPIGTLASLIWLHILKQNNVRIRWIDYVKITIVVIPPTVIFTLVFLAYWVEWLF